ncbi:MAG: hypothetical protein LBC53_09810 [Spirochaetaceae bacterium]|jgi:hypothetical protein|nr:hypothetical protein [Spirochaetaceae bacterium]
MKKGIFAAVFAALAAGAFAQTATQPPDFRPPVGQLGLQAAIGSMVNGVTPRYALDEDNYLNVVNWANVKFDDVYFFLGGKTGTIGTGFQGGLAKKLGQNHVGFYFNGELFSGSGTNDGADGDAVKIKEDFTINQQFAVLFANQAIGGVRLDLLFKGAKSEYDKNHDLPGAEGTAGSGATVTSAQWGKKIGSFTPKATIGFQWPTHTTSEAKSSGITTKSDNWDAAVLGVKLEGAYKDFSADYQLSLDFGETGTTTVKNPDSPATETKTVTSGGYNNVLNLYYGVTADVNQKLQFKLRPQLQFVLAGSENKTTTTTGDVEYFEQKIVDITPPGGGAPVPTIQPPTTYFAFIPQMQVGAQYKVTQKFALYTGVTFTFLKVESQSWASYKTKTQGRPEQEVKATPSSWNIAGLSLKETELQFGANFAFSDTFSLDAQIKSNLVKIGVPGKDASDVEGVPADNPKAKSGGAIENPFTSGSWLEGGIILNFKPAPKAAPATAQ